ncbi:MAG TPA: polyprenyl synthetase family protein [Thermoplasmata archaeon]|nr:polyprenyl synthetase family protein [Thermoplasmata archaeon]
MDFEQLLRYRPPLEALLRRTYRAERRRVAPPFRRFVESLEEFTLRGGKRFRALLLLAGYWMASGRDPRAALSAAAALEHFQTWMLVHDDIIDHAESRRGGPTLHRVFETEHASGHQLGNSSEFGVGIGITLGDLEEPSTVEGLLAAPGPADRRLRAVEEYIRMTRETAYGQLLDIQNGTRPVGEVSEQDVLTVHRLKSAFYTVASPLRIGAILGGGRSPLLKELESVGLDLGVAFQLRDDVLGAGFDAAAAGKTANDLIEGKRTLLVVRAWASADERGRTTLEGVLGHPAATPTQVEAARDVIRGTGSLAYSERRIAAIDARARKRIAASRALPARARSLLNEIGDKLVYRSV